MKLEHKRGGGESNNPKMTVKWCILRPFFVREKIDRTGTGVQPQGVKRGKERARAGQSDGFLWVPKSHVPTWLSLLKAIG